MQLTVSRAARRLATLACLASLTAPLHADVWVVDSASGPGSDFADIQSAVTAAASGDTILVRDSGSAYTGVFVDGKGLTLLGDGSEIELLTATAFSSGPSIEVRNLSADQSVLIRGFLIDTGVGVLDCAGPVWLDQLNVTGQVFCSPGGNAGAYVDNAANLTITRSNLRGEAPIDQFFDHVTADGIHAIDSTVRVFDSVIRGGNGDGVPLGPDDGGHGIRIDSSTVSIFGCDVQGGAGGLASGGLGGFECDGPHATGGHGVRFVAGTGTLRRADSTVAGGFADLDRLCPGQTGPAGNPISGTGTVIDWPASARTLEANGPVRGGETLTFDVTGVAGEIPAILVSNGHAPLDLPAQNGALLLQLPPADLFVLAPLPASGVASLAFAVPNVGALIGSATFYAQAIFLDPTPSIWLGSGTPVVLVDSSF